MSQHDHQASDDKQTTAALARSLGAKELVVLVIAAAAPLSCTLGTIPLLYAFGNGAGAPFSFLVSTTVLYLFSIGYSRICRDVEEGGALYTYIARGLNACFGQGAAMLAILSYLVFDIGCYAYTGYFARALFGALPMFDISWVGWTAISAVVIGILGYRQIDFSAKIIVLLLLFEFGLLLIFDGAIIVRLGAAAFSPVILDHRVILSGSPSIGLMFAFLCYIGFESAAIYSGEVLDPKRSIPLALYIAVFALGLFYILTTWLTISLVGADRIQSLALADPGAFYFNLNQNLLGSFPTFLMKIFMFTSTVATTLALHNAASRYIYAVACQNGLPAKLGAVHPIHGSPHMASFVTSIITVAPVLLSGMAGISPIIGIGSVMTSLGTIGVLALQALASISIVAFYARRGSGHWWSTRLAPLLASIVLGAIAVAAIRDFDLLSGTDNYAVNHLPLLLPIVFCFGFAQAVRMRTRESASKIALLSAGSECAEG